MTIVDLQLTIQWKQMTFEISVFDANMFIMQYDNMSAGKGTWYSPERFKNDPHCLNNED